MRRRTCTAALLVCVGSVRSAAAGGFDIPDNGTQALGRGAAFVAKADDGTAIYHNPAGLARQRGTHAMIDANLFAHSFSFQRAGSYPDDPQNVETPWGNQPFPVVKNTAGPFFAPFAAVSSDFGYFDRLTFAAGIFGPPTIENRTFPLGVDNKPGPQRYDYVQSRSTILYPTLAIAGRVTKWLDLGVSGHLVVGSFDETLVTYADVGKPGCPNAEFFQCDGQATLGANGTSFGATIGAMARPLPALAFGASFRTPININASGNVTIEQPKALQSQTLRPGSATLALQLPWMLRLGGRYIGLDGDFEVYDLELDLTYEAWGAAQATGPIVQIPDIGAFQNVQAVIQHGYKNTFGARGGGAYNIEVGEGTLSIRAGAYFDSSATAFAVTRTDFDTLAKVAGTLGLGFKIGSFGFDLGYAAVASIPRTVGTGVGAIQPINIAKGGDTTGADGKALPTVNDGAYSGFTHILSLGASVSIEGLLGKPPRPIHYGNAYEPNVVDDAAPAKPEAGKKPVDKPPEETKPAETKPPAPTPDDAGPAPEKKPDAEPKPDPKTKPPAEAPGKRKEWWEDRDPAPM